MFSSIFVDRPRLATVIALVTAIAGLAVAPLYSDCAVPGHRAAPGFGHCALSRRVISVVDSTVAQVIESQVIGVDKMIYMKSITGNDGSYSLLVFLRARHQPGHQHGQRQ